VPSAVEPLIDVREHEAFLEDKASVERALARRDAPVFQSPGRLTINELTLAVSGPFPPGSDIEWERQRELIDELRAQRESDLELARRER
jgi:hypothetical protein